MKIISTLARDIPSLGTNIRKFAFRNVMLSIGLTMIIGMGLIAVIGPLVVDQDLARIGAFSTRQEPSISNLLGTQSQGRDVLTVLILALPNTLRVGVMAGSIGLAIGVFLGLLAGHVGGWVDNVIRVAADTVIIIPAIAILVLIAVNVGTMTVEIMALAVASLAWMGSTRTIRAQTLSLTERKYVQVARMNGMGTLGIIVRELMPNLLPYIAASFVGAVSGSMLATVGLEALGLGPQNTFTLGTMIYWSQFYGAVVIGMWWWWAPPIVLIVLTFVSLLLTSAGMDRFVNTRIGRVR